MLCPACHRRVAARASWCGHCGATSTTAAPRLELVLTTGDRIAASSGLRLGRARGSDARLRDPSVSRTHARLVTSPSGPAIVDCGSASGTWVDGQRVTSQPVPLRDGAVVRLGDAEVLAERRRADREAGPTRVVATGASQLVVALVGSDAPRLRSGRALKRLAASADPRRWVLQDTRSGAALRLDEDGAQLLALLDGHRTMDELLREAQARLGPRGPALLGELLVELADRGLLAGHAGASSTLDAARGWRRVATPRRWVWRGAGDAVEAAYRRGGWVLATTPALIACSVVAAAGVLAFVALVVMRYGTPFVVADRVGLGGLVFLLGRFAVAAAHETAHGLALATCGRRVREAGLKLVLIFPYAYVDTSEAWLESARRRIAISAAGPASDLVVGGGFALACALAPGGTLRDVFFQLALAAYTGGLFNLNPFVERDGYHILVDVLGEPGLRARARAELDRRLAGGDGVTSPLLRRYALAGLAWSVMAAGLGIALALRTVEGLRSTLPGPVLALGVAAASALLLAPVAMTVARPLRTRRLAASVRRAR